MLDPLYTAISWVLLRWHALWAAVFGTTSGVAWGLAIVFLVITIRIILFPLFVKQIHSQRAMQELQPKMKELQAKHKGDRETMQKELMALYKEQGANPVAGCLPIFLQAPVFLALFHVLRRLDPTTPQNKTLYGWTASLFDSASNAKIFGAPISAKFFSQPDYLAKVGASGTTVKIATGILVLIMVVTTYITQRQMLARQKTSGQPVDAQQRMVQQLMLYGVPGSLLVSGSLFPLGVVIYWCTTNLWSMGQQFYVLHRMPPPGGAPRPPKDPTELAAQARALAPPPGARPQRPKRGTATAPNGAANESGDGLAPGQSGDRAGERPGAAAPGGGDGSAGKAVPVPGSGAGGGSGGAAAGGGSGGGAARGKPPGGGRPPARPARKRRRR